MGSVLVQKALNTYQHTVLLSIILEIFIFFFSYFNIFYSYDTFLNAEFILLYTYSMEKVSSFKCCVSMNTFKDIGTVHVLRINQMVFQDQYQGK